MNRVRLPRSLSVCDRMDKRPSMLDDRSTELKLQDDWTMADLNSNRSIAAAIRELAIQLDRASISYQLKDRRCVLQLENDRCAGDSRMDRAAALRLYATNAKILREAMAMRGLRGH